MKNIGLFAFKGCYFIQNDIKELQKICGINFDHCFDVLMSNSTKFILPVVKKNIRKINGMKVVIIGSSMVGKTCVSRCFCDEEFIQTSKTIFSR